MLAPAPRTFTPWLRNWRVQVALVANLVIWAGLIVGGRALWTLFVGAA
ncbi:MAG: hypothetical protein ACK41C_10315 [Phenylobacterium sp.]